jgi:ABC-type oligopeptide transport system substrate-binding subunit
MSQSNLSPSSNSENNKEFAHNFVEDAFNKHDMEAVDKYYTVNLIKAADLILDIRSLINPSMSSSSSFYLCNTYRAIFGNKAELNRHILTHSGGPKGGGEGMYSERRVPRGSRSW